MNKNTEGLERFIESGLVDNKLLRKVDTVTLKESLNKCSKKLRESLNSETPEGFWCPISFYNRKNGNGRIYSRKLWENVINNQRDTFVGSGMLTDHPAGDSDGNPKDICGVWLDCKMDEPDMDGIGLVWGLLVPSGHLGEDLKDHLKHGLKVGTSSSGFGKLMRDGETVDPDTYQIERLADWVMNPSQGTYFGYDENEDNKIENRSIKESQENIKESLEENTATHKEHVVEDSRISKLEEKKFRRDMESFLKEADNIKDPQERLEELKDIKSYLNEGICSDLKEQIEKKIADQEAEIKTMLNESIQMKEQLGICGVKDLEEKLTKVSEDYSLVEKESKDWKAIAEQLQEKLTASKNELESRPTEEFAKFLKEKNEKLEAQLNESTTRAEEVVKQLTEACEEANKKILSLEEEIKGLEAAKAEVEADLQESKNNEAKIFAENKVTSEGKDSTAKQLEEANKMIEALNKIVDEQRAKIVESIEKENKLNEALDEKQKQYRTLAAETIKAQKALKENYVRKEPEVKKSVVDEYYDSLYESYGNEIKPFEKKIKSCMTLAEAKRVFFSKVLQNLEETKVVNDARIPESMYISPEERAEAIGAEHFTKTSIVDRKPEGWV